MLPQSAGAAAVIAAGLFALSPALVCYGSEARGYAPMLLAFTAAILLVDRWLAAPDQPPRTPSLAMALGLGFLAQATILFGLAALLGWAAIERWRRAGALTALREMARLFGPALLTIAAMAGLMWLAAYSSPYGFAVGGLEPHSWSGWRTALAELLRYTLGLPLLPALIVPLALLLAPRSRLRDLALWSAFAFPLVLALLALPNSMMPRYYLVASVAVLLWLAEWLAQVGSRGGLRRTAMAMTLPVLAAAMLWTDRLLIENQRGDPGAVITILAALAPTGTTVMAEHHRESAVLDAAAAYRHYPLVAQIAPCPAAPFLLADRHGAEQFAGAVHACGRTYVPVATHWAKGPSGLHWQLLRRRD
ncbi:hypothetical protein LK533_04095 [Sphingomonas sp. PL-96]|uniref:hypothetical protein n=1 Tax=Sphingomonas sp. PL-96 TaxID=2887201 RepID=UPI001E3814E8|nr:hypothetical protein [Sphingomonas sp. PL-96]MCC2975857.1 hypothetical protein [Sphingomonas sp. PL-96]